MEDHHSAAANAGVADAIRVNAFLIALESFGQLNCQKLVQVVSAYAETMPKEDAAKLDAILREAEHYRRESDDLANKLADMEKRLAIAKGLV